MGIQEITSAELLGGYDVRITFDDGTSGIVNLQKYLRRGILSEAADPKIFPRFHVNKTIGTIVWPNGADIAPERLYEEITNA